MINNWKLKINLRVVLILLGIVGVVGGTVLFINHHRSPDLKLSPTPITSPYLYQSINQGFAVYLGNRQEQSLPQVKFTSSEASIDFKPLNIKADSMIIKDEKSVVYQEVLPGIDISYSLTSKGIKEEIIIKTETARKKIMADGQFLFEATVDKALLQKEENKNGTISFTDLQGKKPLFYIPQPFMVDSQNNKSEKITLEFLEKPDNNQNNQSRFTVKLIPSQEWLKTAILPVIIDPTVEISILNVHSHPQAGDNWTVSFETKETANLTITPVDQPTIDDLNFVSLKCGEEERTPQILEGDAIFYPNWQCDETGQIIHLVNVAGTHILEFKFGDQIAYAYNSPYSVTDYFDATNPDSNPEYYTASKTNLTISGGQVKLTTLKDNGTTCSSGDECESSYCVDGVCCNTACNSQTCERCDSYSNNGAGTCGYISTEVDPDNECNTTGCLTSNCKGDSYACGYYTSGEHNCTTACTTCTGATSGSCVNVTNDTQDTEGTYLCNATCKKCSSGSCANQSNSEDLFTQCTANTPVVWNKATGQSCNQICSGYSCSNGLCNGSGSCDSHTCSCAYMGCAGTSCGCANCVNWTYANCWTSCTSPCINTASCPLPSGATCATVMSLPFQSGNDWIYPNTNCNCE